MDVIVVAAAVAAVVVVGFFYSFSYVEFWSIINSLKFSLKFIIILIIVAVVVISNSYHLTPHFNRLIACHESYGKKKDSNDSNNNNK